MQEIERKYPAAQGEQIGGLNSDDAPFAVGINEWVNMQDCRSYSTDNGETATIESVGSTQLLRTQKFFIEIGWAEDVQNKRFCTFYYHTLGTSHCIQCYDAVAKAVYFVLLNSQVTGGLNFQKNKLIQARIVNGILYWTDNYNIPRRINIDAGIKLNQPNYNTSEVPYSVPLAQEVLAVIRKPPEMALSASPTTIPSIVINNIREFAGQFCARYIFRGGEISVLNTPSELVPYRKVTDTQNAVAVVMPDNVFIQQDVQQVDYCVRYGNSGNFFVIKSWNKSVPADALAIQNHNAGVASLSYLFYNDRTGIALDAAYSVKPYDSVPLLSETLEFGVDRLFLGNNLVGYNFPTTTSLVITMNTGSALGSKAFKCASDYQGGLIFRDKYKRVIGGVVTNDSCKISIPDRTYAMATSVLSLLFTVSNNAEIPLEAYTYEFVLTKNLRTRFFIESKVMAANMRYAIKDATTGVITYQTNYTPTIYGIALDCTLLNAMGMGYSFQNGDISKLYLSTGEKANLAVITQDANYIIVAPSNFGDWSTQDVIFEVYTPFKPSENEPFYTTGSAYYINNPGTPSRSYSTNSYIYGDTWVFLRPDGVFGYRSENMSPNDNLWQNWYGDWGQPNFVFLSKQMRKNTSVQWSNVFIEGTQINGLSTFDALDEKILPLSLGVLRKLQQTSKTQEQGNIVLAIGEADTASLYLGEVQVVAASQNAFLASSPNVIGTVNILKGNFGTINPESVCQYRGLVFWLDMINGRVIQYSVNGLFPISEYKMTRFWKQFCQQFMSMTQAQIEALGGRPFVFSIVDPRHDELLFSIPKLLDTPPKGFLPDYPDTIYPFDIWDGQGKTIVFSLSSNPNRWIGAYSFNPEGFSSLDNELYSYKNGEPYLHNQTNLYCNYYGVQYNPKIMVVSNMAPQIVKSFNNFAVQSNFKPIFVYFYNDYPIQQSSDLVDFNFTDLEGIFYSVIYRNKLIPTATGYDTNGLLTGEKMRSTAMFVMVEFSVTNTPLELKFIETRFIKSLGHN